MSEDDRSIEELILDIELKDKRFRTSQSIFMILVTTVMIVVMVALFMLVTRVDGNTVRLTNYLRCTSLTPVQDRTEAFVTNCFNTDVTTTPTKE